MRGRPPLSRCVSYPRVDGQSGRERVPSSFLLRAARAAIGRRVSAGDLARLFSPELRPWGGHNALKNPAAAVDLLERDLALVDVDRKGQRVAFHGRGAERRARLRCGTRVVAPWADGNRTAEACGSAAECGDAVASLRLNGREGVRKLARWRCSAPVPIAIFFASA